MEAKKRKNGKPTEIELTEKQVAVMTSHAQIVAQLEHEYKKAQDAQQEVLGLILDLHDVGDATNVKLEGNKLTVEL